jgi:hypothetical protein
MYNKYSSMKKSQLKEAIKAEIKSVLSEEITEAKFIKFKGDSDDNKMEVEAEREMNTPDGELKVYTVKTDDGVQSYTADQVELVEEDLKEDRRRVVDYDNRDDRTTELFLDNGDSVEVDVIELYDNLKENNPTFADIREEDEMSDDEMDKKASRGAKKEPIGKEAERLAQVQKFMRQMQDKDIVGKDKKILDTSKYKEEFAKFKAGLKK